MIGYVLSYQNIRTHTHKVQIFIFFYLHVYATTGKVEK